jgi:GNAT superfamily N-acetyltransferase
MIRPATSEDIPAIQSLYRFLDQHHVALYPEVFQPLETDARPATLIQSWLDNPEATYLVAEIDGAVVGFLNVRKMNSPDTPIFQPRAWAHVENAVVATAHQGKGLGKALFEAAIVWAKAQGLNRMQTQVWSANGPAHAFYTQQGFSPITEKLELEW